MASATPARKVPLATQHRMRAKAMKHHGQVVAVRTNKRSFAGTVVDVTEQTMRLRAYSGLGRFFMVIPIRLRTVEDIIPYPGQGQGGGHPTQARV